ncbi:hypothetical protein Plhal304r1_c034g0106821 [Plasmopara halstedii]
MMGSFDFSIGRFIIFPKGELLIHLVHLQISLQPSEEMECINLSTGASALTIRASATAPDAPIVARELVTTAEVEEERITSYLEVFKFDPWSKKYGNIQGPYTELKLDEAGIKLFKSDKALDDLATWMEYAQKNIPGNSKWWDVLADVNSETQDKNFAEIFPIIILEDFAIARYKSESDLKKDLDMANDFEFDGKKLSDLMKSTRTIPSTMTEEKKSETCISGKKLSWFLGKEDKKQMQSSSEASRSPVALESLPPPTNAPSSSRPMKSPESAPTASPSNSLRARLHRFLAALWAKIRAILWPFN